MPTMVLQEPGVEANMDFKRIVLNHNHPAFLEKSVFVWDRSIIFSISQALKNQDPDSKKLLTKLLTLRFGHTS